MSVIQMIPKTTKLFGRFYYLAEEIYKYDSKCFSGMSVCKNIRIMIKKKNLKSNDYIFAYVKDSKWIISNSAYNKAKLFLSEDWTNNNIPKIIVLNQHKKMDINEKIEQTNQYNSTKKDAPIIKLTKKVIETVKKDAQIIRQNKIDEIINTENNIQIDINDLYDITPVGPLLELSDNEKFIDSNGLAIEIEVRGERLHNKCFFKVKDVSIGFHMPNIYDIITNKRNINSYLEHEHYKYFIIEKTIENRKIVNKKELYLTYEGMIRLLYVSHSSNAKFFRNWATEKLFFVQMGTMEQKQELSSKLLGVNVQSIKEVFSINSSKTPCVYLILIGSAKKLLNTIQTSQLYNDTDILCKYGCSDDIVRRVSEHERIYKKEFNINTELLTYSIIEAKYIFEAENNIKQYFKSNKVDYKNKNELIVINQKDLDTIKQHFKIIQNSYIGRYEEMFNKIKELEILIKEEIHKNEIKDSDIKLLKAEHQIELVESNYQKQILTKELESSKLIAKLEKQILEQQIKKEII